MRSIRAAFRAWWAALADRPTRIYTISVVVLALAFIAVAFAWHALFYFDVIDSPLPAALTPWDDESVPEYVEAILTLLGAAFLLRAWWHSRDGLIAAWAVVLLVIAADNRFRLHETAGHALAPTLDPLSIGPIEGRHLGELAFWLGAALVLLVVFAIAAPTRTRLGVHASIVLGALLLVLVHFAGGYDLLHVLTKSNLVGFIEDGGEFLCVALVSAYAFAVMRITTTVSPDPPASA